MNGSVLAEVDALDPVRWALLLDTDEQSCGLYDWQVDPPWANATPGSIKAKQAMSPTIRFMMSFVPFLTAGISADWFRRFRHVPKGLITAMNEKHKPKDALFGYWARTSSLKASAELKGREEFTRLRAWRIAGWTELIE